MQIIPAILAILLLAVYSSSQSSHNPFILSEPLPSSYITDIEMDARGFIWIATRNGLCRYDGSSVLCNQHSRHERNTLLHNNIFEILYDNQHNVLWIGTEGGLSILDLSSGSFTNPELTDHAVNPKLSIVEALYQDQKKRLWFSISQTGLARYSIEDKSMEVYPIPGNWPEPVKSRYIREILDIAADLKNTQTLWLGTPGGLLRFDVETKAYTPYFFLDQELETQLYRNQIRNILPMEDGSLWLGTWSKGLLKFTPNTGINELQLVQPQNYKSYHQKGSSPPLLQVDKDHAFYNGASSCLLNLNTAELSNCITIENNYGNRYSIQVNMIDERNRKWATSEHGLHIFDPLAEQFNNIQFPAKEYYYYIHGKFLEISPGRFLIVYENAGEIFYFDESTVAVSTLTPNDRKISADEPLNCVGIIRHENGDIWVVERHKIYELALSNQDLIPLDLPIDNLSFLWSAVLKDESGGIWLGTKTAGIIHFLPESGRYRQFKKELEEGKGDNTMPVKQLFEDSEGNIWIGKEFGYSVFLRNRDTVINFPYFEDERVELTNFIEDKFGNVWSGSRGIGLFKMSVEAPQAGAIEIIDNKTLKEDNIHSIGMDLHGKIWMITGSGLQEFDPVKKTTRVFGQKDGMITYDHRFNRNPALLSSFSLLSDGKMAFAPRAGFCIFNPGELKENDEVPVPYIKSIYLADSLVLSDQFSPSEMKFPFRHNDIKIECSAIAYTHPDQIRFEYRLRDQNWALMENRHVQLTNLAAGDYVFSFRVVNSSGLISKLLTWNFTISIPWWRSWWFITLALLSASVSGWALMKWRVRRREKNIEREREVELLLAGLESRALRNQMNPHFLFNIFNNIQELILTGDTEKAYTYTTKFSKLLRMILDNARKDVITIDQEINFLRLYLELESLRFEDQFEYDIEVEKGLELMHIPVFVVQPLVENAIRHGLLPGKGKKKLRIEFSMLDDFIFCKVIDNGIGFAGVELKENTKDRDHALQLIRNRLSLWKGSYLKVKERKDTQGTVALVCVPVDPEIFYNRGKEQAL